MVCSPLLWSLTETVPVNSLLDLDVVLPLNFLPEMAVGKVLLQSLALELEKVLAQWSLMALTLQVSLVPVDVLLLPVPSR